MNEIKHEKTKDVLKWFEEIDKIPRCSKHEKQISDWLCNWAKDKGYKFKRDKVDSIVIKIPASKGYEDSPITTIQGHMDMVCEKTPDSTHDFTKDPIKFIYDGDWLTADRTTLGADNGIAIAMALTMAEDKNIMHPPLELLFTVDEETGLTGANALEPGFIDGKILLNVDSEDEGVFTVGCAGGINTNLDLPLEYETNAPAFKEFKIEAGGMKGGHSGIDIPLGKANAIQIIARVLDYIISNDIDLRISDLKGGSAHNAIPRDAETIVFFDPSKFDKVNQSVKEIEEIIKFEFVNTDPDLFISIKEGFGDSSTKVQTSASTKNVIDFISALPHGVFAMSTDIKDLVETSNNLANIRIENDTLKILTSQRSSVNSRLNVITNKIESIARLAGGSALSSDGYPPWQPNMDSPLLARCTELYERMFNKKPVVEVIHAGLECGIIGDKYPGMDMISIGPTLKYPHSPDEKIKISTIGMVWDFITQFLKELKS